jgi:hypothetical protein
MNPSSIDHRFLREAACSYEEAGPDWKILQVHKTLDHRQVKRKFSEIGTTRIAVAMSHRPQMDGIEQPLRRSPSID